jgi:hypothetical protein
VPFSDNGSGGVRLPQMAVFWLGRVTPSDNYADVRLGYNQQALFVDVAVIDRRLWNDSTPSASSLTEWDAATVYLHLGSPGGQYPGASSYRLTAQAGAQGGDTTNYTRTERGTGSGWGSSPSVFTTALLWRGDAANTDGDDHGWALNYRIPFASLGLSGPPAEGTAWSLAVALHDRDEASAPARAGATWPAGFQTSRPASWGRIAFGLPAYQPPAAAPQGTVIIRQGVNGAQVPDADVGGHTLCGYGGDRMWAEWGDRVWANESGNTGFVNVQNQRDISDWPCFSKYYVTFPLAGQVPAGRAILNATLTLHQTGGSGGSGVPEPPSPSWIQVLTVAEAWSPSTISWNNAPQPVENVSRATVDPQIDFPGWPGLPRTWDLSYAVAQAYAAGQSELRLVLYSADGAVHSGKYFAPSETDSFSAVSRPTLTITYGQP